MFCEHSTAETTERLSVLALSTTSLHSFIAQKLLDDVQLYSFFYSDNFVFWPVYTSVNMLIDLFISCCFVKCVDLADAMLR